MLQSRSVAQLCLLIHTNITNSTNSSNVLEFEQQHTKKQQQWQSVESLDDNRRGSPAAVADGGTADGGVLGLEHAVQGACGTTEERESTRTKNPGIYKLTHNTSAGAADGVSECHRSAVHVDAGEVKVEQSEKGELLQRKREREKIAHLALMRATRANASLIS